MLLSFYGFDNPEKAAVRQELLSKHRDYLARFADCIAFAGPLLAEDQSIVVGSLLVIEFPSLEAGQLFIANEPYNRAGLYASMKINAFRNRWPQKVGFPEDETASRLEPACFAWR